MDKTRLLKWVFFIAIQQYVEVQSCIFTSPGLLNCTNVDTLEQFKSGIGDYGSKTKKLIIQESELNYLTSEVFENVKNVKTIILSNNYIGSVPARLFENLNNLELLYVENTEIRDTVMFAGLSNLKTLNFTFAWTYLREEFFHDFSSLVKLDLSCNSLQHVHFNAFTNQPGLSSLTYLSLASNFIWYLDTNSFRALNKLEVLRLENNQIWMISAGAFLGLSSLTVLDLSNNMLWHLTPSTFEGLENLNALYLQNNDVDVIDPNTFDVFKSKTGLQILHLYGNDVEHLPGGIFENFDSLNELVFDDRNLVIFPHGIFNSNNNESFDLVLPLPE